MLRKLTTSTQPAAIGHIMLEKSWYVRDENPGTCQMGNKGKVLIKHI